MAENCSVDPFRTMRLKVGLQARNVAASSAMVRGWESKFDRDENQLRKYSWMGEDLQWGDEEDEGEDIA
jgi:hypothetical protein